MTRKFSFLLLPTTQKYGRLSTHSLEILPIFSLVTLPPPRTASGRAPSLFKRKVGAEGEILIRSKAPEGVNFSPQGEKEGKPQVGFPHF